MNALCAFPNRLSRCFFLCLLSRSKLRKEKLQSTSSQMKGFLSWASFICFNQGGLILKHCSQWWHLYGISNVTFVELEIQTLNSKSDYAERCGNGFFISCSIFRLWRIIFLHNAITDISEWYFNTFQFSTDHSYKIEQTESIGLRLQFSPLEVQGLN